MRTLKTQEYIEELDNDRHIDQLFDEMYWDGGFCSLGVERFVKASALEDGVALSDVTDYEFDALYQWYRDSEKGLS